MKLLGLNSRHAAPVARLAPDLGPAARPQVTLVMEHSDEYGEDKEKLFTLQAPPPARAPSVCAMRITHLQRS
jgi:hypothetical protein